MVWRKGLIRYGKKHIIINNACRMQYTKTIQKTIKQNKNMVILIMNESWGHDEQLHWQILEVIIDL